MARKILTPGPKKSFHSQSQAPPSVNSAEGQVNDGSTFSSGLPREEYRYRTLIEQLPAILYVAEYGPEGPCYFVSPKIKELLGFEPEDWTGGQDFWIRRMHPDDRERALAAEEEARRTGKDLRCEYRLQHRDGSYRWFRDEAVPLRTRPEGPPLLHGVLYDIQEAKKKENALRQAEARYREVIERLPAAAYVADFDPDSPWRYVSPQIETLLGVSQNEWLMKAGMWLAHVHPDDRGLALEGTAQIRIQGGPFRLEYRMVARDGRVLWVQDDGTVYSDAAGQPEFIHSILTDITERKKKEQELQESEQLLRLALEASGMGAFDIHARTGGVSWDLRSGQLFQMPEQMKGRPFEELVFRVHPEDREAVVEHIGRALSAGSSVQLEFRIVLDDGSVEWRSIHGRALRDAKGEIVWLVGIGQSITERKRAEEALRESRERLRATVDRAPLVLFALDKNGVFQVSEGRALQPLGLKPGQVVGESIYELYKDQPKILTDFQRALSGEEFSSIVELRSPRELIYETVWSPARGPDGTVAGVAGVATDITERVQAEKALRASEERLRMAQKMEAVGQLAGGVAHDFNNLLTVIRGHAEMLQARVPLDAAARRDAEAIQMASDRAAAITQQLLAFSRKQVLQPRVIELRWVVHEIATLLQRLLGSVAELRMDLPAEPQWVLADETQFEQVLLNLVINARDAMPRGGTITVELAQVNAGSPEVSHHPQMPAIDYVRLRVRDTGTGMDVATQARIFEPFFTTKELGKGTGLGLATVYGIVKQSGGWIWVDSAPGAGTTFDVYLPAVPAPELDDDVKRKPEPTAGWETILVVDDEEGVRELSTQALRKKGYRVLTANSGTQALEIAGLETGPIHALITDAFMSGMVGPQLAQKLRETRGDMRVLYISGYAEDTELLQDALRQGGSFLQKPFTLEQLALKLREVLGGSPASKEPH